MVPDEGVDLNHFEASNMGFEADTVDSDDPEENTSNSIDYEEVFDMMARWNTYLENHVPYYSEGNTPDIPEP